MSDSTLKELWQQVAEKKNCEAKQKELTAQRDTLADRLKKLEKSGFLTTYSQEYQGRKRKYYSITPEGKTQIGKLNAEWLTYKDTIDGIIEGRLRN